MRRAILLLLVMGACTRNNPDYCDQDSDCTDASKPFCDVNGEYAESDHTSHTCTMTPANCPVDRCPCAPGKGLSCSGDDLISCAEDGHSTQTSTCTLGCSADQPHCLTFDPVNGLGVAMDLAAMEADVILSAGTKIDTSVGTVLDSGGNMIPLRSVLVAQNGGAMIRAFVAKSFVIDGLTVTGTYPVAIVSPGPITIRGQLDASASGTTPGPGAQDSPATCAAPSVPILTCYPMQLIYCNKGAGGGGGVTSGGAGGGPTTAGGAPGAAFGLDFLAGGCHGGHLDTSGGGGGGGAVQITSATSILLVNMGLIDVGGGGGQSGRGGGSGGTIILEAPTLRIDGPTTGLTANGGGGGGCGMSGQDGQPTVYGATAPQCGSLSAGYGANMSNPPGAGAVCTSSCPADDYQYGGGGGALGRVRVLTSNGTYESLANPIVSAQLSVEPLMTH